MSAAVMLPNRSICTSAGKQSLRIPEGIGAIVQPCASCQRNFWAVQCRNFCYSNYRAVVLLSSFLQRVHGLEYQSAVSYWQVLGLEVVCWRCQLCILHAAAPVCHLIPMSSAFGQMLASEGSDAATQPRSMHAFGSIVCAFEI